MHRIIKFRGRKEDGQWLFGNLIVRETDSPVPETPQAYKCVMIGEIEDGSEEEVEEETVGQYTGINDANGSEIYEGDVVRYINGYCKCGKGKEWIEKEDFIKVEYNGNYHCNIGSLSDVNNTLFVVGNIHDKPELLKICKRKRKWQ